MAPRGVLRVAKRVSRVLAEQQVPHALAGALAVGLYGYNRWTADVDFVVPKRAQKTIEQLGPGTPRSGLKDIFVKIARVDVHLIFVRKPLRRGDISSPVQLAGLPVIGVDALVAMKVATGRGKDTVDVVELLKLGRRVSIEAVSKRLSGEKLKQFQRLVTIANLEQKGQTKEARRIMLAMLIRAAGSDRRV